MFTSLEHYSESLISWRPSLKVCWIQFPFISTGPPLGMSRLTRPVVLAALLITSIHLRKTRQDKTADTVLKLLLHDFKAVRCAAIFWDFETRGIPFKRVLAFCPEKVNMGLKLQFEDVLLVDAV